MIDYRFDPQRIANALGGEVVGRNQVLAPGPGHSATDRSLPTRRRPVVSLCSRSPAIAGRFAATTCERGSNWRCGGPTLLSAALGPGIDLDDEAKTVIEFWRTDGSHASSAKPLTPLQALLLPLQQTRVGECLLSVE
jgi:hypothetical protein